MNTEETIEITLAREGLLAGITLYPTKVTNERAANMIKKNGAERILINSSADWGKSYPLNVAEAAKEFQSFGLKEEEINRVVFENAFNFFSQSPKFKLED